MRVARLPIRRPVASASLVLVASLVLALALVSAVSSACNLHSACAPAVAATLFSLRSACQLPARITFAASRFAAVLS